MRYRGVSKRMPHDLLGIQPRGLNNPPKLFPGVHGMAALSPFGWEQPRARNYPHSSTTIKAGARTKRSFFCNIVRKKFESRVVIRNSFVQEIGASRGDLIAGFGKISCLLNWIVKNFPGGSAPILVQAAYTVAVWTVQGRPISLKGLINSLGCSEAGLRKPLKRLVDEGWVVIERDPVDQRVRRVSATEKMLLVFIELSNRIAGPETVIPSTGSEVHQGNDAIA